jgi:hypothetical protein
MLPVVVYVYQPILLPLNSVEFTQIGAVTSDTVKISYRLPAHKTLVRPFFRFLIFPVGIYTNYHI